MAARTKLDTVTEKPKHRYRVTNWAKYDRALVSRGSLTIWFDDASVKDSWTPPRPVGRGKPGLYSDVAIQTCLTLKTLFRLPYRATEGLVNSLIRLCQLDLPVPDHTHMSRRAATVAVKIPRRERTGPVHGVVDSTGLKIFGEGEWKVRQHGVGKRRTWRKIHLAVDLAPRTSSALKSPRTTGTTAKSLPTSWDKSRATYLRCLPTAPTIARGLSRSLRRTRCQGHYSAQGGRG
jgi:hypothetical protein